MHESEPPQPGADQSNPLQAKPLADYGVTIVQGSNVNWLRQTRPPLYGPQFVVERGADPTVAVVAFTGFAGKLSVPTFDFLRSSELLGYSRVLLSDHSRTCYLAGIPPAAAGVQALAALLRQSLDELAPQRTMFIGSSGGSHAAILFGHLLRADYVHSFAPFTNVDPSHWRTDESAGERALYADTLAKLESVPPDARSYFDLRNVLTEWNGKTRYNLHVCAQSAPDLSRARHLEQSPGVTLHLHPCNQHRVVVWLAGRQRLLPLLKMENQIGYTTVRNEGSAG